MLSHTLSSEVRMARVVGYTDALTRGGGAMPRARRCISHEDSAFIVGELDEASLSAPRFYFSPRPGPSERQVFRRYSGLHAARQPERHQAKLGR
jgi:hypothetical protein